MKLPTSCRKAVQFPKIRALQTKCLHHSSRNTRVAVPMSFSPAEAPDLQGVPCVVFAHHRRNTEANLMFSKSAAVTAVSISRIFVFMADGHNTEQTCSTDLVRHLETSHIISLHTL